MRLLKNKLLQSKMALVSFGILLLLLCAAVLLWSGEANSNQATNAMIAGVYFDGEYRIGDQPWQPIVSGQHIPATQGDVTLRGNFHMVAPDGEYVGIYSGDMPLAFYTNHINLTFHVGEEGPYIIDAENPLFGKSSCGEIWTAHAFPEGNEDPIEIVVHNPHSFGNETAIDEMLSKVAFWSGIEFEKGELARGSLQRNTGLLFLIVSFVLLGTALFSTLIHFKGSNILWLFGMVILSASAYFIFSADGIAFWQDSVVSNTTVLGFSMVFYMLFLSMVVAHFLTDTKKAAAIAIAAIGVLDTVFLLLPVFTKIYFYDTWFCWAILQGIVNIVLLVCLIKEFICIIGRNKWGQLGLALPLLAFIADAFAIGLGLWKNGMLSKYVFIILFFVAMVIVLRIIPQSINAAAKAKELETERNALNAQLAESRISTMMSQIRPHFIYNTLGSIEYLCEEDPPKARKLVHSFAKYLRGNFGELDNPRPIRMSQEMEHIRHYLSIEKVRFPDMTFTFDIGSGDFMLPALSVQPIVENAIKHGLMPLDHGGSIRVTSWETPTHHCVSVEDDGVGFDPSILSDSGKHIGLRNIRGRLETMVNGTLEVESTIGHGTKVQINIPKDGKINH